ncbi:monovalent cation/H+ antiporter complex subunit F [Streptomyces sp. NBC_00670]|uniref:monovalent cation/H+ antiporter complex subunit F n=1 Tax=Streptomyces sp. NBC_00670 TaxID=2975804 RepID=UPI002E36768B|nr:monovalent cation/H+ antiporter complex subunit F [Streptomyces sp. NBC_00670]
MNGWTTTATVALAGGVGATLWGVVTGPLRRRVVAQNLSSALAAPALLLLAQGYDRPAYVDLALVLALLGPVGTLVFARLLADELAEDPPGARNLTLAVAAYGAVVVVVLCVVAGPGRAMVKLLIVGALLIAGNLIASRALSGGFGTGEETARDERESNGRG